MIAWNQLHYESFFTLFACHILPYPTCQASSSCSPARNLRMTGTMWLPKWRILGGTWGGPPSLTWTQTVWPISSCPCTMLERWHTTTSQKLRIRNLWRFKFEVSLWHREAQELLGHCVTCGCNECNVRVGLRESSNWWWLTWSSAISYARNGCVFFRIVQLYTQNQKTRSLQRVSAFSTARSNRLAALWELCGRRVSPGWFAWTPWVWVKSSSRQKLDQFINKPKRLDGSIWCFNFNGNDYILGFGFWPKWISIDDDIQMEPGPGCFIFTF